MANLLIILFMLSSSVLVLNWVEFIVERRGKDDRLEKKTDK